MSVNSNHSSSSTPGKRLRTAVFAEQPLQVPGVINAYYARMVEREGFRAAYVSGGGVSAGSLGVPDLGISTLEDVLIDVRRVTDVCSLPLLVDVDTGFGGVLNIGRTIRSLTKAGAGGCHIEDQVEAKRCGHRPGKAIVPVEEMIDRIKAAVDARIDESFVIMARTDALANEGLNATLDRAAAYVDAGADMIFPEAIQELPQYRAFADRTKVPVLANITEFGMTPLFTLQELRGADVALALYPLSAFRAMNAAAVAIYRALRNEGTQKNLLHTMQTRAELYDYLGYAEVERKLDLLFAKEKDDKWK